MDLKTMYKAVVNSPVTYLSNDITPDSKTILIENGEALPDAPNIATLGFNEDSETILYMEKTDNQLKQVVRGFQGNKQAWDGKKTPIARLFTAYDLDTAIENIKTLYGDNQAHATAELPHLITDTEKGDIYRYGFVIQNGNICFKAEKVGE